MLDLDDPGDTMGEHRVLPLPAPAEYQNRPDRRGYRLTLRVVEGAKKGGDVHKRRHGFYRRFFETQIARGRKRVFRQAVSRRLAVVDAQASGLRTSCSANLSSATIRASTTGPISEPMNPKAATPPITPTNTVERRDGGALAGEVQAQARCPTYRRGLSTRP